MCSKGVLKQPEIFSFHGEFAHINNHTVDGSTRNPARKPVEVGSLSHYLQVFFIHPRWLGMGFLPSASFQF